MSETKLVRTIPLFSLNTLKLKHQAMRSLMCRIEDQAKNCFLVAKQNWSELFHFPV